MRQIHDDCPSFYHAHDVCIANQPFVPHNVDLRYLAHALPGQQLSGIPVLPHGVKQRNECIMPY